ncbi:MAG: glycosyltransferase family 2 protein [Candidatus Thermoplasmatota archaeon]|nr:glycosyltransferase family 2 protein [Candidatus Thermoplasmatota archaeon]
MKVSIVIPTINEEKTIGGVIEKLRSIDNLEIIIVDTNSTDKTREIARAGGAIVIEEPRRGYGLAYKRGFDGASGEILVGIDGDGTYPAEAIKPLVELLITNEVDFISGDRMTLRTPHNYTMLHFVGNSVLNFAIRTMFGYRIIDSQSGLWVFRSGIYKKMRHLSDGMSFSQDIKIEATRLGKFIEIPIKYGVRATKPKLRTWEDGFSNLFYVFVKRVRISPLHQK